MNLVAHYLEGRVSAYVGDITRHEVDAIVNAANSSLLGGGGVDGAIHRAGGPSILEACRSIRQTTFPNGLPPGEVVKTTGGNLPCKWVIHTVGPVYGRHHGQEPDLLASCYQNALALAATLNLSSIAFPAISTGVYGYPANEAAKVVSAVLSSRLPVHQSINEVRLVFFNQQQFDAFETYQTMRLGLHN